MRLLHQVIKKIRVNSVSTISELVTNVKCKHLGLTGCEEQVLPLKSKYSDTQKWSKTQETKPDFYWNNCTVAEVSI